jgi:hypothetical protein
MRSRARYEKRNQQKAGALTLDVEKQSSGPELRDLKDALSLIIPKWRHWDERLSVSGLQEVDEHTLLVIPNEDHALE